MVIKFQFIMRLNMFALPSVTLSPEGQQAYDIINGRTSVASVRLKHAKELALSTFPFALSTGMIAYAIYPHNNAEKNRIAAGVSVLVGMCFKDPMITYALGGGTLS